MTDSQKPAVAFLGLGAMGTALARRTLDARHPTIVWNRSRDKAVALAGAHVADTARDAVEVADVVVVCLFDHESVHDVLDPIRAALAGRRLVNVTTTAPGASRELAAWAAAAGAHYLDGGIMAVPEMIGSPFAGVLYSGSRAVFDETRDLLETWGRAKYFGEDPGMASLYDLSLLAAMYVIFAGFFHGAAMVGIAGVSATEFAARATPWLQAMANSFADYAAVIDSADYTRAGQQSLEFSDLTDIVAASRGQGVSTDLVDVVQRLIHRQIESGHGRDGFARMIESIKQREAA